MHPFFPKLYSVISFDPEADALERQWRMVENITKNIKRQDAFELVLAYNNAFHGENKFTKAVIEVNSVTPVGAKLAMQVLAGGCLLQMMSIKSPLAVPAALAMVCSHFDGFCGRSIVPNLNGFAERYLHDEGERQRVLETVSATPNPANRVGQIIENIKTLASQEAVRNASLQNNRKISPHVKTAKTELNKYASDVSVAMNSLIHNQIVLSERAHILSWLWLNRKKLLSSQVGSSNTSVTFVSASQELAARTLFKSPPIFYRAILDEVLDMHGETEDVTLAAVIDGLPQMAKEEALTNIHDQNTLIFCPVLTAISVSMQQGDDRSVGTNCIHGTIDMNRRMPLRSLTYQLYREFVLTHIS